MNRNFELTYPVGGSFTAPIKRRGYHNLGQLSTPYIGKTGHGDYGPIQSLIGMKPRFSCFYSTEEKKFSGYEGC